jgi:hypothetical protein
VHPLGLQPTPHARALSCQRREAVGRPGCAPWRSIHPDQSAAGLGLGSAALSLQK